MKRSAGLNMPSQFEHAPANKRVKVLGKSWLLRFVRYPELGKKAYGDCLDNTMRVKIDEPGPKVFDTIVHETLRAACWWLDEEHVAKLATDLSTILLRPDIRAYWDRP